MQRMTPSNFDSVMDVDGPRRATIGDRKVLEFVDALNTIRIAALNNPERMNAAIRRASRSVAKRTDTGEIRAILLDMASRVSPLNRFNELAAKLEEVAGGEVSIK